MGRVCVLLLASACFHPHYDHPACGPGDECPGGLVCVQGFCASPGDGVSTDASLPGPSPDGCTTFSRQLDTCTLSLTMDLDVSGAAIYNTDTHELRIADQIVPVARATIAAAGDAIDAILAHDVTLRNGAVLRAVGNQPSGAPPFAIIASGNVTIENAASIDVSDGGAGALAICPTPAGAGGDSSNGAGGGGGGGYGAAGGDGGTGNVSAPPVHGGSGAPSVALFGLHGGCPGARGGTDLGGSVGAGGRGGGTILVVAAGTITLAPDAVLTAGGGGGQGGPQDAGGEEAGGGGGGSGGLIVLEAPHVLAAFASIAANGGGGGEGSSHTMAGNPGAPGSTTTSRAPGGRNGSADGANGGQGGSREVPPGESVTIAQPGGGGGGGGGVGYVRILSPDAQLSTNVSPEPILDP
jgi:hypothetical protein